MAFGATSQAHKYSNSTTADLWNALSEASGKPVVEIAAGWTEQPGFPVVNVKREANGKVALSQERFTINFPDNPGTIGKFPSPISLMARRAGHAFDVGQNGDA